MEVGGNEIFRYMYNLINPAPQATPYDPIRDEMIQQYGPGGQDANLVYAFQFMMEAGGKYSSLLKDYHNSQELFCDPKSRKPYFSAYKIVCQIPLAFSQLRLAVLLYTWKQPVNRSKWCSPPPDLSGRFEPDAKVPWLPFLRQLEAVLSHLRYVVIGNTPLAEKKSTIAGPAVAEKKSTPAGSAVAEKKSTVVGSIKQQTQFMLELSSSILASLTSLPPSRRRTEEEKTFKDIQEKLAKVIGLKVRKHYAKHWPNERYIGATLFHCMPPYRSLNSTTEEDPFWVEVNKHIYDDALRVSEDAENPASKDKQPVTAVVAADLVPIASTIDERGMVISAHETVFPKGPSTTSTIKVFPVREWMSTTKVNEYPKDTAKRVVQQCCFAVTQQMRRHLPPIQLAKLKNQPVSVFADKYINTGQLIIRMFFRKYNSIVVEGEWGADNAKAIAVDVEWTEANISERLAETGVEAALLRQVILFVKEEMRLPSSGDCEDDWSGNEHLHPFWFVKRHPVESECNCMLMRDCMGCVTSMDFAGLKDQGADIDGLGGVNVYVYWPYIVNTKAISPDEEVVLHFDKEFAKKRQETHRYDCFRPNSS